MLDKIKSILIFIGVLITIAAFAGIVIAVGAAAAVIGPIIGLIIIAALLTAIIRENNSNEDT